MGPGMIESNVLATEEEIATAETQGYKEKGKQLC
jgi:hypothetical protein